MEYSGLMGLCRVATPQVMVGRDLLYLDHVEWVSHENESLLPAEIDYI